MDKRVADQIRQEVKNSYDSIASEFSATRNYLWDDVKYLAGLVKEGSNVLDIGCGNGRLAEAFKERNIGYTGIDISRKLINLAQGKYPKNKFIVGDALALPFSDNSFDAVFFIASLQQIPLSAYRLRAMREAARVLKPGGLVLWTNWNLWRVGGGKGKGLANTLKFLLKKIINPFSPLEWRDVYVKPWGNRKKRYYHAFTKSEFKKLASQTKLKLDYIYYSDHRGKTVAIKGKNIIALLIKKVV